MTKHFKTFSLCVLCPIRIYIYISNIENDRRKNQNIVYFRANDIFTSGTEFFQRVGLICFWLACRLFLITTDSCGILHTWNIIKIRAHSNVQIKSVLCRNIYPVPKSFSK